MMKRDSTIHLTEPTFCAASQDHRAASDAEHGGADKARHKLGVRHPWGKNPSMTL